MNLRNRYTFLTATILAIFAIFVIWPGFVIDSYVHLRLLLQGKQQVVQNDTTSVTFPDIDFTVPTTTSTSTAPLPPEGTYDGQLTIPSIGVNGPVIISKTQDALNKGFWHIPGSALPGQKGNIVVSSHRWLYKPPHPVTFYRLDEVKIGDSVYYTYAGKRYEYRITETRIVEPTEVGILSQDEDKLTLFTCHPLFSTEQRFVVIAKLSAVSDIAVAE